MLKRVILLIALALPLAGWTEPNCPPSSKGHAVKAATCRFVALRSTIALKWPAALGIYDEMVARNVASAKKFAVGKITAEQYVADAHVYMAEFEAKNAERTSGPR